MAKKKVAKKSAAKKKTGAAQFTAKIRQDVPNDKVFDLIGEYQQKAKYVSHTIVPQGGGKSTIVFVLRR